MFLKSIELTNFRQFRDVTIDFAQGKGGENVTIIIGENGSGKTTFAQAFLWCLYGETSFSDKMLLNKKVGADMVAGDKEEVKVILKLDHGDNEYTLYRKQEYEKNNLNSIKGNHTVFNIAIKDVSGNTTFVKKTQCESEVINILPKQLSKYFFFDGERIEKISKDISTGRKATEFADAVEGLLGLNAMKTAIGYLNPRIKNGVIRSYEDRFDSSSNTKIKKHTETIDKCNIRLEEIDARLEELDSEILVAQNHKTEKLAEIKQYAEGEKLQEEREKLQQRLNFSRKIKSDKHKEISREFNNSFNSFFSLSLIKRAFDELSEQEVTDIDIPSITSETIEYLIKQEMCICGTRLVENSEQYNNVIKWINFLPPQSVSSSISDFKRESKSRIKPKSNGFLESISSSMARLSDLEEEIASLKNELMVIDQKLSGDDMRSIVRKINDSIKECDLIIKQNQKQRDELIREKGSVEKEKASEDDKRNELALLDERNKKTQIYLTYANRIYSELNTEYENSEAEIRQRLENTMNELFKHIYDGGLYLTIDEKYHIIVNVEDYEGDIETSTAQSISVVFAFITSIIKIARENRESSSENAKLLSSEAYPLVMDAPLSTFDKRRIKTVCGILPTAADQVIVFIKDTDGEIAEEHMGMHVGSRHTFNKLNELETIIG